MKSRASNSRPPLPSSGQGWDQIRKTKQLTIGGLLCLSKKWLCRFFEKASLRSAPLLPADSGQFDAHSAQSVFCHAHVAAENVSYCFRVCGRETLRGFFDMLGSPPLVGCFQFFKTYQTFKPSYKTKVRRFSIKMPGKRGLLKKYPLGGLTGAYKIR